MYKIATILGLAFMLSGCEYFKADEPKIPVARVNNSFLYQEDIKSLISENTSKEDSTLLVNNYINRWATQQLLMDQAKINIPENKQETYNKLVEDYRKDLYTEAYKNVVVSQTIDSTVSARELQAFYEESKENFKLNDELFKVRYIQVAENFGNLETTRSKLESFSEKDQTDLATESIQYKTFNFNDSIWVKRKTLLEVFPILQTVEEQKLNKSNFLQLQDSLGVYLVKIVDKLNPNDTAPLSHVEPTIKQVILNKRKLELIKKLEKDITTDALKNNNFEIYENQ
ncbi:MAG: peptidylprolyl isomerase [Flavobacteriaceae bacterium]|nr:peptidylprolyl isomerase [Flavobacteriaceae bacterium]|tara:strand:+ start:98101 stop:98955 length:855 start_codon:yes stop_codon:yes gene_type:complete